jgi:NitT/TauT family transport system ATP-binding protein
MDEPLELWTRICGKNCRKNWESIWIADPTTVLMVTHDVDEAVFLSDRVIVMSSENGRIAGDVGIKLPRPRGRNRQSDAYQAYKDQLTRLVHSYHGFQEEKHEES